MPLDSERVKPEYFHLATQYYTAARYSARAALTPVCGNLFHHAIELYVKGALREHVSTEEMKDLGHRLNNLWARFNLDRRSTGWFGSSAVANGYRCHDSLNILAGVQFDGRMCI